VSAKMHCQGCDFYGSSVLADFQDGNPCRNCGLPHEAAVAVLAARERGASEELITKFTGAEQRATAAERKVADLERRLSEIRDVLDSEVQDYDRW
jgi:hypothetical protein